MFKKNYILNLLSIYLFDREKHSLIFKDNIKIYFLFLFIVHKVKLKIKSKVDGIYEIHQF